MILLTGQGKRTKAKIHRKGFTLIELLIVCAIILALVSFSMPLFRKTFAGLELRETASNISKLMAYAQERAIIDSLTYRIAFDFDKKKYQLFICGAQTGEKSYNSPKDRFGQAFNIPGSITIEGTAAEILFYPDGRSDVVELKLRAADGRVTTVSTTGLLGNFNITEAAE